VSRTLMSSCKTITIANDKEAMVQLDRLASDLGVVFFMAICMFREINVVRRMTHLS
jgi:hypothetical protein